MILGEIRKIFRNKMFLVVTAVILLINILTIMYCLGEKNEAYMEYRNEEQSRYIGTYAAFIAEVDERGDALLSALDHKEDAYYKRNVDKMVSDYQKLSGVRIDGNYNWGVEKYADFTYGIFFCIAFAFVCMEYLYISERKSGMIHILRAAKNGRRKMILSKWAAFAFLLILFVIVQEILVLILDTAMYSMGNLDSSVQSLQIFRDCPYPVTMRIAVGIIIFRHIGIGLVIGSILFFCMIVFNSRLLESIVPVGIFGLEFFQADNCPVNLFYCWDMKHVIGRYQNMNLFQIPVDKNIVSVIVELAVIIFIPVTGAWIFRRKYISEFQTYFQGLREVARKIISKPLHAENMVINEFYKLFVVQKKWLLLLLLCTGLTCSGTSYMPDTTYQSAYEAVYHMHLSKIHGRVDDTTAAYIEEEKQYIQSVEAQVDAAIEKGEAFAAAEVAGELESRKKAFERLSQQYEKITEAGGSNYMIDEMNLESVIKKYRSDCIVFIVSSIVLVMFLSGLYGSKDEVRMKMFVQTTKNGRKKLSRVKLCCAAICGIAVYTGSIIPSAAGYAGILEWDELKQSVACFYEPQIGWNISLFGFFVIIYLIRAMVYLIFAALTTISAGKTGNEFAVSVFVSIAVIVIALIMYFSKSNIPMLLIRIANRGS